MPVPLLDTVQYAGFAGISHTFDEAVVHDVALGGRIARGPWAGVLTARVGLDPADKDGLATTLAVIADDIGVEAPLCSVNDIASLTVAGELGVPTFGRRFSGGPFLSVGAEMAFVRRAELEANADTGTIRERSVETLPTVGARFGVGASWSLGRHLALRLELQEVVRGTSLLVPDDLASADIPAIYHEPALTFTLVAGK